ncbi:CPBP family intramembrane glutamic endopeptidase [Mucilaginibacter terrae]|uniref:Membrane protease YdiL (CAAX protease family) n=1 Tax=Mucilaginibacter terrae TaxID=1955052 RepID=A0ABU3GQ52_9SPHI|nr:CPBP family intramembrane glutamic endopeptidase [Mucilaginibacter terrae]MDT3401755.1 membrane protease YdiL (CAAX protease family) [Mucilaginibacter terrae]
MKQMLSNYREWLRLAVAVCLMAAALIGSGFIDVPYVPVGLLLVVLVNWIMFRSEKFDFSALGFDLNRRHLLLVPLGLLLGMLAYMLSYCLGAFIRGNELRVNTVVEWKEFFNQFWRVLPTAAVQDFLVVGYCYHKLIRLTNVKVATTVVGLVFVAMHDVWGASIANNLFYALGLFAGYLMLSTALIRSGSIWLVIGLHWGNNFTNSFVFTFKRSHTSWLYLSGPMEVFTNWQGIGLLVAFLLNSVSVIMLVRFFWRNRLLCYRY